MSEKPELFMRAYITGLGGDAIDIRVMNEGCILQVDVVQDLHGWKQLCNLVEKLIVFQSQFPHDRRNKDN